MGLIYTHNFGTSNSSSTGRLHKWLCDEGKTVILIERDPRDQLISSYFEYKYRTWMWHKKTFSGNITKNLPFLIRESRSYNERIDAATKNISCVPKLLVIRYETLFACTACVLEWVYHRLTHVHKSPKTAVARCNFDVLESLNSTGKWGRSIPAIQESNKFRTGAIGTWRTLIPDLNAKFDAELYVAKQVERERTHGIWAN